MKNSKSLKTTLLISGAIGAGIGSEILFSPVAFHATSGIELGNDISLLNEVRASGGALLASGILIMLGAFVARLTFVSLVISALLYLSYGVSRILSMVVDGTPDELLVQVAFLEIAIGLVCGFMLFRYRAKSVSDGHTMSMT